MCFIVGNRVNPLELLILVAVSQIRDGRHEEA